MQLRPVVDALRRIGGAFPLTPRGVLVAALCAGALRQWGYARLDLVVFALSLAGLALLGIALALVGGSLLALRGAARAARSRLPARLEADRPLRSGFSLPALERVPLVALSWELVRPPGVRVRIAHEEGRAHEELVPTERGEIAALRRRFRVGDALGLARLCFEWEEPASFAVLPATRGLRRLAWLHAFASGEGLPHPAGTPEGDRMEMRRYVPGDSVRHILWKTFARTRTLEVRTPERSIDRARRTLAYLVAAEDDEAAAAAARVALESRALGEAWLFGADGSEDATERLDAALRAVARSAGARAKRGGDAFAGLARFLASARADAGTHCVVFAPASLLPRAPALVAAVRAAGVHASCVFAVDTLRARAERRPLWERALFAGAPEPGVPVEALAGALARLRAPGCTALVVERATGRVLGGPAERAWRLSA